MQETLKYPAKILTALHATMTSVGYVQKKGKNTFQNYKYAGEGNLLEVLRPAMVENGLLLIPSHREVSPIDANGITVACVEYTLAHKDGDVWPEKIVVYGAGGDKNSKGVGDKGLYKALTGANKYLLFKLFQIETGDDPEKDSEQDAPANDAKPDGGEQPVKNAPGITKARAFVDSHLRHLHGSEDGADFMLRIAEEVKSWDRVRTTYPNLWKGPDGGGLYGEARKGAAVFKCLPEFDAFITSLENPQQEAAE